MMSEDWAMSEGWAMSEANRKITVFVLFNHVRLLVRCNALARPVLLAVIDRGLLGAIIEGIYGTSLHELTARA